MPSQLRGTFRALRNKGGFFMPISIQNLHFQYEGRAEPVFDDLTLSIDERWRLGLIGRNGRGKTTLLRLLAGQLDAGGAISATLPFFYFPFPVEDPAVEVRALRDFAEARGIEMAQFLTILRKLGFARAQFEADMAHFSDGQKKKALIPKSGATLLFVEHDRAFAERVGTRFVKL